MLVASTAQNNEVRPNWQQSSGHHFRAGGRAFETQQHFRNKILRYVLGSVILTTFNSN